MANQMNTGGATYRRLLSVSKKYWLSFFIGVLATIALSLSDAGFTWLIDPIVNKGFIHRDGIFIKLLPIFIFVIFVVRATANFCSNYFIARVSRSVVMDLRQRLFEHLLKLPSQFYDQQASGKLLSTIIYNVEQVAQASSDVFVTMLRETSLIVGLIIVMMVLNWRLSLIFLVITPLIAWGIKICSKRLRFLSTRVQSSVAQVSHISSEAIDAYKVIRLFGGQQYETERFAYSTRQNLQQELKVIVTNSINASVIQLLIAIPLAIILYLATSPRFGVTAGSFAAIISAMVMIVRPIRRVTNLNSMVQKGIAGAASIFELLDEPAEKDQGLLAAHKLRGDIVFRDVCFSYQNSIQPALEHINLNIHAGETVAIVGHSGGGKSTLISLLPRFYEVSQGEILIDGVNINDYRLGDLRQQFSVVSQHTVLFNDTIANNIAYAQDQQIDRQRLIQAAQSANALDFIEKLPQGFDTMVGEDGLLLSGGQRQRIAIARALYKQAAILILDEATSSLDTQAERQIQTALNELMRRCTTLVIAHRLSTIENADWILVVENGKIVEKGQHEDLLKQDGVYAELYRMQFQSQEMTA